MVIYDQVYKFWLLGLLESYLNFKDAANHAEMTQSALSQNIKGLEDTLGKSLVVRGRGRLKLTESGRELLAQMKPILGSLEKVELPGTSNQKKMIKTKIKIGTYESVSINLLPRLLKKFSVLYPGIKLDIHTSRNEILPRLVRKGELDLAIAIDGESDSKIQSFNLATDELGLYVSPEFHLLGKDFLTWIDWPLASVSTGPEGQPLYYERFINSIPDRYQMVLSSDSFETIRGIVASGTTAGILPVRVAERKRDEMIKIWPLDDKIAKLSRHQISLISRRSADAQIVQIFKNEMMDCLSPRVF